MIQNFLSVLQQVGILYILIFVGFVCGKLKFFNKDSIKHLSTFVLFIVTPCVIIDSFNREYDSSMLKGLLITFACAFAFHAINILVSLLCLHDNDEGKEKVLRFASIFSNCGYMALPLQQALFGNEGVFYSAAYIAIFNIVTWSFGAIMMSTNRKAKKSDEVQDEKSKKQILPYIRKAFLNPGVIGITIGLVFFFSPINLPLIISSPIKSLAVMNTPIPMIVIGFYLSEITSFDVLKNWKVWLSMALRLIILPIICLTSVYALGLRGILLGVLAISASTPTAANTVMFSSLFDRDTVLASEIVSMTTLFSIFTMPLLITIAVSLS